MWKCPTCGTEHRQLQDMTPEERTEVLTTFMGKKAVPGRANGGRARAAKLSPERRSEIARSGAYARWKQEK